MPPRWRYQMCFRIEANGVTPAGVVVNSPPTRELIVRRTDTGTDKDGNFDVEYILCGSTVGTIDANSRQSAACGINLNEVATSTVDALVLLITLQGSLRHRSNNLRASTNALSQCISPVSDLTDVDRDVRVLRRRGDSELNMIDQRTSYGHGRWGHTGCHWKPEMSGTWMNNHWPATYLKLGLIIRSSMAPD